MNLQEKYARFLIQGCLRLTKEDKLFIIGEKEIQPFIDLIVQQAKNIGIQAIDLFLVDIEFQKKLYLTQTYENIIKEPTIHRQIFNQRAKEGYAFLSLSSPRPNFFADVAPQLLAKVAHYVSDNTAIFQEYQIKNKIKWNISAVPNTYWADYLHLSLEELWKYVFQICLINQDEDPIKLWNQKLDHLGKRVQYLNGLQIKKLHYKNNIGTNLTIELPENYRFCSADGQNLVNMPTEEVFTSPYAKGVNGIVYASKPLENKGKCIQDFWLEFNEGKVVKYGAKEGLEVLKGILETDEGSKMLGEVALVDISSPIAQTNLIFHNTLIDENASCHLALGQSFAECIQDGLNKTTEELVALGLNQSLNHVDFFIGTNDLEVVAETKDGQFIKIMEQGNFKEEKNEII